MAKNYGARRCARQIVICASPSVNKTPMGNSTPPVPYPVQHDLSEALEISPNVRFNKQPAFTLASNTQKVQGDAAGTAKGIKSGTVSAEAGPIEHSGSVRVNGQWIVRCGDKFYMNHKNTTGTLTCSLPGEAPAISDDGKIETDCGKR